MPATRPTRSPKVLVLLALLASPLAAGCASGQVTTLSRTLGEIRLLSQSGEGAEFHGDSVIRRRGLVASDGRCALYEIDELPRERALLGQRRVGEVVAQDRVARWEGRASEDDSVERAMVFAPDAQAGTPDDPDGVRVGVVFEAPSRASAPWLLECSVPQTGRLGLPESLLVAVFATGREARACSHDHCTIAENGLIPMRSPTGDTQRVALRGLTVQIQAIPRAAEVWAERRAAERVEIALDFGDGPEELRLAPADQERLRRRALERRRLALREALLAAN